MVFLTFARMVRYHTGHDKFWRKEMYRRMSWAKPHNIALHTALLPTLIYEKFLLTDRYCHEEDDRRAVICSPEFRFQDEQHFYGRRRNCFGLAIRYVRRALRYSSRSRVLKKVMLSNFWNLRISAACEEHGLNAEVFRTGLAEADIALNRKVLSDLAIYEPRTFSSLVEFVKQRNGSMGITKDGLSKPDGVITRGML